MDIDGSKAKLILEFDVAGKLLAEEEEEEVLVISLRDITERKRAEEALAEKTMYLDNILRNSTEYAISTTDLDFRITYYNPMAEKLHGYKAEEVIGKTVQEMHTKDKVEPEQFKLAIENVRRHGEHCYTVTKETEEGTRYIDVRVSGIYNSDGELVGYANFARDVTERKKAEEELRASEKKYRNIVNSSTVCVAHTTIGGEILYVNEATLKIFGYDSFEEVKTLGAVTRYKHPEDRRRFITRLKKSCKVDNLEVTLLTKTGEEKEVLLGASLDKELISVTLLDITERKRAEVALRSSEEKYRLLTETADEGIYIIAEEGFEYINPAFERITGYAAQELLGGGLDLMDLIHPDDRQLIKKRAEARRKGREVRSRYEFRLLRKDKEVRYLDISTIALPGEPWRVMGIYRDITEQKQAEEVWRRYAAIVNTSTNFLTLINRDYVYEAVNDAYCQAHGKSREEIVGHKVADIWGQEVFEEVIKGNLNRCFRGEQVRYEAWFGFDYPVKHCFSVTYIPYYDEESKVTHVIVATRDITERKQAEEALIESELWFRSMYNSLEETVFIVSPKRKLVHINAAGEAMFGYSEDELKDFSTEKLHVDHKHFLEFGRKIKAAFDRGEAASFEFELKRKNGDVFPTEHTVSLLKSEGGSLGIVSVVRDITEKKQAEEALRKSEEQFRTLAEKSPNMIFINQKGKVVYANRQSQIVMGYSLEEFLAPDFDFRTLVAAESLDLVRSNYRKHSQGKDVEPYDCTLTTKDGRRIETIIATKLIEYGDAGAILAIMTDITAHKQVEEALQVERSYLEMLQAVTAAANEAACFEDAVRVALEHVCRHTGWPVGHVYLPDEEQDGRLVPSDIWYLKDPKKYKAFLKVTKETTFAEGIGLPGRVLATGEPAWIKDLVKDKNFLRIGVAKDIGVRSGFAFPVKVGAEVVAVLEFFAEQQTEPDEKLLEIISHVGTEVGRALERNEAMETLRNIATGASAKTGKAFFTSLVEHLARTLGSDYAFVGELSGPKKRQVKTVAVYGNGEMQENFNYRLKGTPCDVVLSNGAICFHPKGVQQLFPDDKLLIEMEIEAYSGIPLLDSQGTAVGILVVCHRTPMSKKTLTESTLEIFAARVAAELERQAAEGELQQAHDKLETRVEERTAELVESSRKYRHLFEHAHDSIFIVDPETRRIMDVNENTIRRLGYTRQELLKLTIDDLSAPESLTNNDHMLEELRESGSVIFEHLHQRKDGSTFPVEISSRIIQVSGQQVIQSFVRDISERRRAEQARERLLQELENKNQDLQQILHISSHDLRSPLVSIKGFSGILDKAMVRLGSLLNRRNGKSAAEVSQETNPLLSKEIPAALDHIVASTDKMESLLSGLSRLSRLGQAGMNITELDMNELLAGITKSIEFLIKKAKVQLEIGELPPSRGDEILIGQVFSNLLGNAVKYLNKERRGVIRISGEKRSGSTVYVVEDNGIGIEPDYQQKVFDLFHRVNPSAGNGEGLGLTITRKILDRHHGRIWLESQPGKGSKFFVELPD